MKRGLKIAAFVALGVGGTIVSAAQASPFTAGDLAVYRTGDGSATLGSTATAVFIDEYSPTGTLVQSIPMPTASNGANAILTASGSAASEGIVTLSPDGTALAVSGYNATLGTTGVASGTAARVVGVVNGNGAVDTTTTLGTSFSGNNIRGALVSSSGIYAVGGAVPGAMVTTQGSTANGTALTSTTNFRAINIFGGQLFGSTQTGSALRLGTIGTGVPTTGSQTFTNLPGFETSTGVPVAFFFADLNSSISFGTTGLDTLYVADSSAGIQKWTFDGTNWTQTGTAIAFSNVTGLTGRVSGNSVTLYGTSPTSLSTLTDSSGYGATDNGTLSSIATNATNEAFRGVAFAPTPEPGSIGLLTMGAIGLLARRRRAK